MSLSNDEDRRAKRDQSNVDFNSEAPSNKAKSKPPQLPNDLDDY
jgi:hypothetical protein